MIIIKWKNMIYQSYHISKLSENLQVIFLDVYLHFIAYSHF